MKTEHTDDATKYNENKKKYDILTTTLSVITKM